MRLHALTIAITDLPNPSFDQLREFEVMANSICGRDRFLFRPMDWSGLEFDTCGNDKPIPLSACEITYSNPDLETERDTVCSALDAIVDILNYERPWIKFMLKSGLPPGRYEIGEGLGMVTVGVTVNKTALETYKISKGDDLVHYERELKASIPDQTFPIDLRTADPQTFLLKGEYRDLKRFQNQHLKAEAELKWQSVWPCYYGVGPLDALDNPATVNAFIQSLTKAMCCKPCINVDIAEGMVLYYFFPFDGMKKEFRSETGVMRGSYKGIVDGMRTKSMDDYGIAGGRQYGVIRTDQPGIRFLDVCVIDYELEDVIKPEPPVILPVITYPSIWSEYVCSKIEEAPVVTYSSFWSGLMCKKDELVTINWQLSEWDSPPNFVDANMRIYVEGMQRLEQFGNGSGSFQVIKGSSIRVQYFYLDIARGTPVNPFLQLLIDSIVIDSKPVAIPGEEGFNHSFTITGDKTIVVRAIESGQTPPSSSTGSCYTLSFDTSHGDYDPNINVMTRHPSNGVINKRMELYPSWDDGNNFVIAVCSTELPLIYKGGVAIVPPQWVTITQGQGSCTTDLACLPPPPGTIQ
jgi:hypothetical protein